MLLRFLEFLQNNKIILRIVLNGKLLDLSLLHTGMSKYHLELSGSGSARYMKSELFSIIVSVLNMESMSAQEVISMRPVSQWLQNIPKFVEALEDVMLKNSDVVDSKHVVDEFYNDYEAFTGNLAVVKRLRNREECENLVGDELTSAEVKVLCRVPPYVCTFEDLYAQHFSDFKQQDIDPRKFYEDFSGMIQELSKHNPDSCDYSSDDYDSSDNSSGDDDNDLIDDEEELKKEREASEMESKVSKWRACYENGGADIKNLSKRLLSPNEDESHSNEKLNNN